MLDEIYYFSKNMRNMTKEEKTEWEKIYSKTIKKSKKIKVKKIKFKGRRANGTYN